MGEWRKTTAKVLNHLRSVFDDKALKNATEQEQAAVKRVWAFIGVKMREYYDDCPSFQWGKVAVGRRNGVRQQLLTRFPKEAFLDDASGKAARKKFTRADLLAWGEQLLNPADAAANAVSDANAATSAEGVQGDPRAEADVQKPEGGEAADAAANVADGAAVADRVAVETTNAAVADAAAAFSPAPQERGPPAGEPTASEGVDGELPLCLNDVSSQTANSYNQMTIKTHGHVVYDFEGKKRINLQDLTDFACMKKKKRSEVKRICASVYFLRDLLTTYPLPSKKSPDYEGILKQINERTAIIAKTNEQSISGMRDFRKQHPDYCNDIEDGTSTGTIGAVEDTDRLGALPPGPEAPPSISSANAAATTAAETAGLTNAEHNSQMQSSPTTASWQRLSPSFRAWFLTASKPSSAPSSVGSYLSHISRSDRGTPNPSPSPSSWVSYLSNLRWLKNVRLGRDVANGSLQLDDERPMTRRELRAAKRRAEFWAMMREERERDARVWHESHRKELCIYLKEDLKKEQGGDRWA